MSTKQRRRDVKKNDKNLEREGLSAIFYNASKNLYLKRKVRKQVLDPPLHVKVVLYIFFFAVLGCLYILYSHQHAHGHHKIIHERKMAHKRIIRERYKNNNKHMIGQVKSSKQQLSEVDILKYEMKKLQEENEKLKKKPQNKKNKDDL